MGRSEGRKMKKVNPDAGKGDATGSIPTIDCLVLNMKETKQQATRMTEVLQFARLLPHPLPAQIPPSYLAPGTSSNGHTNGYHNGHHSDSMELEAVPSSSSASNGLVLGLGGAGGGSGGEDGDWLQTYRLSVKHRVRKDLIEEFHTVSKEEGDLDYFCLCDMWNGDRTLTRHWMKKALQDEWEELVQSYFKSVKKLRRIFPPPPHIKAASRRHR